MSHIPRHPLLWLIPFVAITIIMLRFMPRSEDIGERLVLTTISIAYFLACLSILTRTRWTMWTMLGAGLLATMLGDAMVYSYILSIRIWPGWSAEHLDLATSILLAPLFAGGIFVVIGLSREMFQDRHFGLPFRPGKKGPEQPGMVAKVERAADRTEEAAERIETVAEELKDGPS